ncbi:hypothetical protein B0T22DRAFT_536026 [Podospora appendiculata]|uniref:Mid2 domain-containing protein n=1 Tax=Podospora appendiculata TaxID=314037 RepID=A0AAE1CCW3_9PEZI|nr:hypothetical protein B0T22DRAFT_536026 [Podospora appendiculata]
MARTTIIIILALFSRQLVLVNANSTCYDTWGHANSDHVPCSTGLETGNAGGCCKKDDYCLSNGLCLGAGTNLMMQQGCTDPKWGSPCKQYCPAKDQLAKSDILEIALIPCAGSFDGGASIKYCCGPDAQACCQSASFTAIPTGTIVRGNVAVVTMTATPTPTDTSNDTAASNALKIALGVGLGVGLPVLLTLCAIAALIIRQRASAAARLRTHHPMTSFGNLSAVTSHGRYYEPGSGNEAWRQSPADSEPWPQTSVVAAGWVSRGAPPPPPVAVVEIDGRQAPQRKVELPTPVAEYRERKM